MDTRQTAHGMRCYSPEITLAALSSARISCGIAAGDGGWSTFYSGFVKHYEREAKQWTFNEFCSLRITPGTFA